MSDVQNFDVSVVIPVYNKQKMIESCLRSVVRQRVLPSEIIVVDDGSTDSSREIVGEFFKRVNTLSRVLIIFQDNKGVSHARNVGIESAASEYIALLDADDEWEEGFLYEMHRLITDYPRAAVYSTFHKIRDGQGNCFLPYTFLPDGYRGYIDDYFTLSRKVPLVNSSKVILRKAAVLEEGGFPIGQALTEDLYLWFKLALKYEVAHLNRALVTINQFPDQSRTARKGTMPYIISFFVEERQAFLNLTAAQKKYLFSVFYKHIFGSFVGSNYREAAMRLRDGYAVFGAKALALVPLFFIPPVVYRVVRENIRRKRSRRKNSSV